MATTSRLKQTTKEQPYKKPDGWQDKPLFAKGKARPHYVNDGLNVMEAARNRMSWIFDEFDNDVSVASSGGKDSTVTMELAADEARKRGVKLRVVFLDQEAEYQGVVDYMRKLKERPEINLEWYQIPFKLFNATSHTKNFLNVWGEGEEWMRDKEPDSIHENPFFDKKGNQIDRFKPLLTAIDRSHAGAHLTGMRSEESPTRRVFLVSNPDWKWATWSHGLQRARTEDRKLLCLFHPIYDWKFQDIWKAIHENNWTYNSVYDKQYQYGVHLRRMRVSSFSHSQSLQGLNFLREAEPETYERAVRRLEGISTHKHVGSTKEILSTLPYMFKDWEEYMFYLNENLVEPEHQPKFVKMYDSLCRALPTVPKDQVANKVTEAIMKNGYFGDSLNAWVFTKKGEGHKVNMKAIQGVITSEEDDFDDADI